MHYQCPELQNISLKTENTQYKNMKVRIKYFGITTEFTKKEIEVINIDEGCRVSQIRDLIENKYNGLKTITYKIAINQSIENENILVKENDEVVLLPPFAGG